jgi:TonB family protein
MTGTGIMAGGVTTRLFAFIDQTRFAVPRRGAVKVWTNTFERRVNHTVGGALAMAGAGAGLAELRLDITPDGRIDAARLETSSGSDAFDAAVLAAVTAEAAHPPLPTAIRDAAFLLLVEFVPAETAALAG